MSQVQSVNARVTILDRAEVAVSHTFAHVVFFLFH